MRKILKTVWENILLISTLFLLIFIPLYPKIPLLDVSNTWVYIRVEDFFVTAILTLWIFLVLFKKVKLKTPLTLPIFIFWIIGAISTLHGVLIIFPTLANVFPNVAFLSFIRRVEYLSLFFIAFSAMKDKKYIYYVIYTLAVTLFLIVLYGLGQKYLGFPAYLTMNEEFAKGVPLQISALGRVSSTFAGHYDLAAYLVLVIPIFVSLAFGFKSWGIKFLLLFLSALGFGLLFLTVSRVSFFVLLLSLLALLIFQRKKIILVLLLGLTALLLVFSPALSQRFTNTVSDVNVLVDAKTGAAVGEIREMPREAFKDRLILRQYASVQEAKLASTPAIVAYTTLSPKVEVLMQPNAPTGENLPKGTGYVNLSLSPVLRKTDQYLVDKAKEEGGKIQEVRVFSGNYLIKEARAFDLSFTTRFQGEWPKTLDAFRRNIFLGSGYGSVSLAVDNNYLRILGESGILGFLFFFSIFLIAGVYIKKSYEKIDSPVVRSFVVGFVAGSFGLILNGILIDVFEASKIAFSYWILMGIVLGTLYLYNREEVNILNQLKKIFSSSYAVIVLLFITTFILLFPGSSNYFVGDDFTWLRWAVQAPENVLSYFTQAEGFFYRPGTKVYFQLMYQFFWLNQTFYHLVSIFLHFATAALLFLVLRKILKNYTLSVIGVFLFIILSGYHEAVLWISSTGFLFTSAFALCALLSFIYWRQKNKKNYLILALIFSLLSPFFHEVGVVTPLLLIAYDLVFGQGRKIINKTYLLVLSPLLPYLFLRVISQSHWLSGDYSYNLVKFPFNFVGNLLGYFILNLTGPQSLTFYEILRTNLRDNLIIATPILVIVVLIFFWLFKFLSKISMFDRKILVFGLLTFVITLLPFLGLGDITSRYSYLPSIGFVIIISPLLKHVFGYLRTFEDRYLMFIIIVFITLVFMSLHLFQIQKIHKDWDAAGKRSERFLVSFQSIYKDFWRDRKMTFYFVDVPIKHGEAWIFPVGLKDALWFIVQNENIQVSQVDSLSTAFSNISVSENSSVFVFEKNGEIVEYQKRSDGSIIPIK